MKSGIHPQYQATEVTCSCGNTFTTRSTAKNGAIHADQNAARKVGRRFAELTPIHKTAAELEQARADLAAARELAAEGDEFAAEASDIERRLPELEERLAELLAPRDPSDGKDV